MGAGNVAPAPVSGTPWNFPPEAVPLFPPHAAVTSATAARRAAQEPIVFDLIMCPPWLPEGEVRLDDVEPPGGASRPSRGGTEGPRIPSWGSRTCPRLRS